MLQGEQCSSFSSRSNGVLREASGHLDEDVPGEASGNTCRSRSSPVLHVAGRNTTNTSPELKPKQGNMGGHGGGLVQGGVGLPESFLRQ